MSSYLSTILEVGRCEMLSEKGCRGPSCFSDALVICLLNACTVPVALHVNKALCRLLSTDKMVMSQSHNSLPGNMRC